MILEVQVPDLGESITEATIGEWLKHPGDAVTMDEPLASMETDKVAVELLAPTSGVLTAQLFSEGNTVAVGTPVARIDTDRAPSPAADRDEPASSTAPYEVRVPELGESITEATIGEWMKMPGDTVSADEPLASLETDKIAVEVTSPVSGILLEHLFSEGNAVSLGTTIALIQAVEDGSMQIEPDKAENNHPPVTSDIARTSAVAAPGLAPLSADRHEHRVPMTPLRQTIAKNLKEAQNSAAILTTFNDADMSAILAVRDRYNEQFQKRHGVRLGFMSFFVKAACLALKGVPEVNAAIVGDEIIYRDYADISVAVSTPHGLVVPVLRDAQDLSFSDIEKTLADFGERARDGKLRLDEMKGGTFTISNGGVFGSLLSTPIINPPQSAVLGLHRIEDRPVVIDGQVVVRPIMYLALSYDHRLIDGREAVTFLTCVKAVIEDPKRLLLDL